MNALDLSPSSSLLFLVVTLAGLASFVEIMSRRLGAVLWGKYENRWDRWPERVGLTLRYALAQSRMPQEFLPGLLHIFIFAGFLIVSLRTLTLFGIGITGSAAFALPGLSEAGVAGQAYRLLKDLVAGLVIIGCFGFAWRRLISRPVRMQKIPQAEAVLILGCIVALMLTDILLDAAGRGQATYARPGFAPVADFVAQWMPRGEAGVAFYQANLWLHCLLILGFLNYLPFGKHFHILTSVPNVFFGRLTPDGRIEPIHNLEETLEKAFESGTGLGAKEVEDFSWKTLLDVYSCTECGRCVPQCPAWSTGKPLSLRDVNKSTRAHLEEKYTALNGKRPLPGVAGENGGAWSGGPLTGGAIREETIWSCTLCRDCEERCPVLIEMVPRMIEMRRTLTLMESSFSPELAKFFTALERHSNPWGLPQADRGKWLEGTTIQRIGDVPDAEYLFFVGCMGSYDERSIKTSKALATVMKAAGVRFGVLAEEESCNGETARRLGNEHLAQAMMAANIETFEAHKVRKIVTNCPHCYNTLKNEYPDFGGRYEVVHATQLVSRWIREGKIRLRQGGLDAVAFHDPCFLGRYNGELESPRSLVAAVGARVQEPSLSGRQSFCCGAGGGRMWMEEHEPRINAARFDEIERSCNQPGTIGVACPFCRTMLSDASKSRGREESVAVKDVVELVAEHLA